MINPTGKKLEKLLFGIFDDAIQSVDTYNHNGSMWLIFTDEMKWVVEYTKEQTLWYNYYFFKNEMEMINLDCIDNEDLIQKWFESRFLNKNEVKETDKSNSNYRLCVEDTIQNGVKHTRISTFILAVYVEDTIQNGVKHTRSLDYSQILEVEDTIQNGVKDTQLRQIPMNYSIEDTIQNGVKHIACESHMGSKKVEKTIQNGRVEMIGTGFATPNELNDIIETNKITE